MSESPLDIYKQRENVRMMQDEIDRLRTDLAIAKNTAAGFEHLYEVRGEELDRLRQQIAGMAPACTIEDFARANLICPDCLGPCNGVDCKAKGATHE